MGLAEESEIPDTATTFLPQRWRQASLATAHLFQEVQEVWLVWTPQEIPVKRMTVLNSILSPHTYVLRVLLCSPFLFFGGMTFKILHPKAAKRYFSGEGERWRAKVLPKKTFRNTLLIMICARKTSVFKRRPCKAIRIAESRKCLIVESGFQGVESRIQDCLGSFTWV